MGVVAAAGKSPYCTVKHGIIGMTKVSHTVMFILYCETRHYWYDQGKPYCTVKHGIIGMTKVNHTVL